MSIETNIASIGNGFAVAAAVRSVSGVLPLPLHLHLLPYPGSGSAGLASSIKEI